MLSQAQRTHEQLASEREWLEFSDRIELSPASVWVLDYETEISFRNNPSDSPASSDASPVVSVVDSPLPSPVAPKELEQAAVPSIDESTPPKASPQVRVLDESRVLPGEASFATVVLNQEIEGTAIKPREELRVTNTQARAHKGDIGLDESRVLPGEASFATVILDEQRDIHTYSPITEFLARTNLNKRQLTLATLLVVSVLGVSAMVLLNIATSEGFRSQPLSSDTASHGAAEKQETVAAPGDVVPSSPALAQPAEVQVQRSPSSVPLNAGNEVAKTKATAETERRTVSGPVNAEASRNAQIHDAKPVVTAPLRNSKSAVTRAVSERDRNRPATSTLKPLRTVKEPVAAKRRASPEQSGAHASSSETAVTKHEPPPTATDSSSEKSGGEPKVNPVTNGAQRPRRVTP